MADRKRTPDVLAELLSADLPAPDQPAPPPVTATETQEAPRKAQPPRDPKPRPQPVREPAPERWETEIVSFQDHKGWRPRFVNGTELKDWLSGALIHDYVNQRGAEGWELAATSAANRFYGAADNLQLYFKRRK
jgi:hypothetical protein